MQRSSKVHGLSTFQCIVQGTGLVLMMAFLAVDQSPFLAHIYDWLQFCKRSLLTLF